jgi:hypothetical protein
MTLRYYGRGHFSEEKIMHSRLRMLVASLVLSLPLMAAPAFSAGDGGGGGGGGNGGGGSGGGSSDSSGGSGGSGGNGDGANTGTICINGKVWDKRTRKCIAQQSGIDDDTLYEYGRDLALVGRYDESIKVLSLAADKTDVRILNYLGYAHRKSGRVLVGLGYYEEALNNDPDYTLVREYLGEAHLQLGDVAAARAQLGEIEKRCGTGCKEYVELAAQIDAYVKG